MSRLSSVLAYLLLGSFGVVACLHVFTLLRYPDPRNEVVQLSPSSGRGYYHIYGTDTSEIQDRWEPRLQVVDNVPHLVAFADSIYAQRQGQPADTAAYVGLLDSLVRDRFFYGYCLYRTYENWLAVAAGHLYWSDIQAKIDANDVLKARRAACSQITQVMMEALSLKQIPFRAVFWTGPSSGHYTLETRIGNQWHYLDPTLEVEYQAGFQYSAEDLARDSAAMASVYPYGPLNNQYRLIGYEAENRVGGRNMRALHSVLWVLSWFYPLLLVYPLVYLARRHRRKRAAQVTRLDSGANLARQAA